MTRRLPNDLVNQPITRRSLLAAGGLSAASLALGSAAGARRPSPHLGAYPFQLGVASGEPSSNGVVLWTKLAPAPLEPAGGMPDRPFPVRWTLAKDPELRRVVRRGETTARPRWGHSVHVEAKGLEAGREYYYAFEAAGERSAVGRTRTAPRADANQRELALAVASCQHYEQGYWAAYRDIAEQELDFVLHVGDYIYEGSPRDGFPRKHLHPEPMDLEGYRLRYAQYRLDPQLQAAHRVHPWIVTWDDHEVDNDWAGDRSEKLDPPELFRARRMAAFQAYWEYMPLPKRVLQRERLYRRPRFGRLAEFSVLDTRSYRDPHPCPVEGGAGGGEFVNCAETEDPARTLLGERQRNWLFNGFRTADATWNVVAQQVLMARLDLEPGPEAVLWSEIWDGYGADRRRVLEALRDLEVPNPVVLSGDFHSFWVSDLKSDFKDGGSPVVAPEFLGTSISSRLVPEERDLLAASLPENPHVKFFDGDHRGYLRCHVTKTQWETELRAVTDVAQASSPVNTIGTWVVEQGSPEAIPA